MNVLLDECTPRVVKKMTGGHTIRTAQEMGWGGYKNGDLLTAAEDAQFDVFITTDKNLRYQQNIKGRKLALLVLPSNKVPTVEALIPFIESTLTTIQAGDFVEIPLPSP
jgi:hypothetical protein